MWYRNRMDTLPPDIENRITRYEPAVDPEQLTAHPLNFRRHPTEQRKALRASIKGHGWVTAVLATADGTVIDGHARVEEALSSGATVPVLYTDLDEHEAGAMIMRLDPIAAMATYDAEILDDLLGLHADTWSDDEDALEDILRGLVDDEPPPGDAPEDADDVPTNVAAISEPGDVWVLRSEHGMVHRVICGNCQDEIPKLSNIDACFADPPYFQKVEAEWDNDFDNGQEGFYEFVGGVLKQLEAVMVDRSTLGWWCAPDHAWDSERLMRETGWRVFNHIVWHKGDNMGTMASLDDMRRWRPRSERLLVAEKAMGCDGPLLSFMARANHASAKEAYAPIREKLVGWRDAANVKNNEVDAWLGTNGMASHYFSGSQWALPTAEAWGVIRTEFMARGVDVPEFDALRSEFDALRSEFDALRRPFDISSSEYSDVPRKLVDVWDDNTPLREERHGHPTPKPVDIARRWVSAATEPMALVYDPFLGSGTTLIACEIERRTCYGTELSPTYVDTICARWQGLTGVMPERETTGEPVDFIGGI